MLSINMDDVTKVLNSIKSQLIGFGVVAVLLIAVMIACRKQSKSKKYLIRWQAGLGMVLALAITVNLILTGPMYSMVTLATGGGKVSEENVASATQLCEDIADEGIVLLDNDGTLPMAKNSKLNVFGWASTNPCYGGTGSGALSDAYPTVTLLEGLKNAGFELNTELSDFYTSYRADRPVVGMFSQDWTLPEPEAAQYTDEMMNNAKAFSDTAMVVITRVGGEGADLPTDVSQVTYDAGHSYNDFEPGDHYLQLSKTEKDMIDLVCKNFDKVVVVYNGANAMELGWVKDYSQIKSVVWCAGTGQSGFNALGSILCGDVNPSGRTIDTFVYDLTQTPTANNFGNFNYTNMDEFKANSFGTEVVPAFVNYVEGIYVGYRYFDTFRKKALFPFGYGLSYTEFRLGTAGVEANGAQVTVRTTVENTGTMAGRQVVQVYLSKPAGKLDVPRQELCAFAKTRTLAPGEVETVTCSFTLPEMAAYDAETASYILEAGDHLVRVGVSSAETVPAAVLHLDKTVTTLQANNVLGSTDFTDLTAPASTMERPAGVPVIEIDPASIVCETIDYARTEEILPEVDALTKEDAALLLDNLELLEQFGFGCEDFGDGAILVREVPADLDAADTAATLEEFAQNLRTGRNLDEKREALLHTMACKAAIKGGWTSDPAELKILVEKVQSGEVRYCPHGRPVVVKVTKYELEKLFKRA